MLRTNILSEENKDKKVISLTTVNDKIVTVAFSASGVITSVGSMIYCYLPNTQVFVGIVDRDYETPQGMLIDQEIALKDGLRLIVEVSSSQVFNKAAWFQYVKTLKQQGRPVPARAETYVPAPPKVYQMAEFYRNPANI